MTFLTISCDEETALSSLGTEQRRRSTAGPGLKQEAKITLASDVPHSRGLAPLVASQPGG